MQTNELLSLLEKHATKHLLFEFEKGRFVAPDYHITEIKNVTIDSVDCGARTDFWKETVIQLWESPEQKDSPEYMVAGKALEILKRVDGIKPLERATEVKFEYGNLDFHTAQLFVNTYEIHDDELILNLGAEKTNCKAKEDCGVTVETTSHEEACCSPSGGCC